MSIYGETPRYFIKGQAETTGFYPTNQITLYLLRLLYSDNEIITMFGRPAICYLIGQLSTAPTKSKQGNEQMRSFEPTNERADCWPASHSYNFIIRVKQTQQIKSNLIGWIETSHFCLSFNEVSWRQYTSVIDNLDKNQAGKYEQKFVPPLLQ